MSIQQKVFFFLEKEINAGGTAYLPPTACPRSAHHSAYVAATGRIRTSHLSDDPAVRPVSASISYLELQHDA